MGYDQKSVLSLTVCSFLSLLCCPGCFPASRVFTDRQQLNFVDKETKQPIDTVLSIELKASYIGIMGPDDAGGPLLGSKVYFLSNAKILKSGSTVELDSSRGGLISIVPWLIPIGYGGGTERHGFLVVAPGYRFEQPDRENEAILLTPADKPRVELEAVRQTLAKDKILPQEDIPAFHEIFTKYSDMREIQIRLNSRERKQAVSYIEEEIEHLDHPESQVSNSF